MSVASDDRVRSGARGRTRYAVLAAAFLVLTGLRAADGAALWAAVFAAIAGAYLWLWVRGSRSARGENAAATMLPTPDRVSASVQGHTRAARLWSVISVTAALGGVALLASSPTLALVLGVLSVVALYLVRRSRRAVMLLQRLPGDARRD